MAEEKKDKTEKVETAESAGKRGGKINVWMVTSLVLVVILIIFAGFTLTGKATAGGKIAAEDVGKQAKAYIEANLLPSGSTILINNVTEQDGVYLVSSNYQGRDIPIYMTLDGKYMFLSAVDITVPIPEQVEPASTDIPKTDKPKVELFVMSFCPYGVQAENAMKPVYDLMKNSTDFKVRFIVNIGGDTVDSVQSLHGAPEAQEDLRQVCVMKYAPENFWNYLMEINTNCYPIYRDAAAMDTCWKATAAKFGIDVNKTATCASGSEGLNLLKLDETAANAYGVSGSPTLIINGGEYSGGRTPEEYKAGICGAFNTAPSACSQTLGSGDNSSTSTGGCA